MADPTNTTTLPGNRGCVACGASNPANSRFCTQCGASMPPQHTGGTKADILLTDARKHLLMQHWEEAALAAEAALALSPDIAEAHHIAAVSRLKQGMRATAERHAARAVELDAAIPEYHATLLQAQGMAKPAFEWNRPSVLASLASGFVVIVVVLLLMANRNSGAPPAVKVEPTVPTGQLSPYAQTTGNSYPQPVRPSGSSFGKPRIAARAASPGPTELTAGMDPNARTMVPNPLASMGPSGAVGLSPASPPVDTTPLNRFGAPDATNPTTTPVPQRSAQPAVTQSTPNRTVVPPPAQPGGGTLFGGSGFGPPTTSTLPAPPDSTLNDAAPVAAQTPQHPSSPHQAYLERDYGAAINGYLSHIRNGEATGSNYQLLGYAYVQVGDRPNALSAYRAAARAYQAQIQAGVDTDLATRGLKNTQNALARLENR